MMLRFVLAAVIVVTGLIPVAGRAAQFAVCATDVGLRVAHGQLADRGWVTQGWVKIGAGECQTLSITNGKPIDMRLLAVSSDGSGIILTSRLPVAGEVTDPTYMRDEELVCGAQTDFESVGTVIFGRSCPDGQEPMVLPMRVLVPAAKRYRLSF